jgi:choline dehydrogenase
MGIPTPRDSTNGDALGSFFMPASVDPRTNTRSSARTAHHERAEPRDNYHLLTDHLVTRILFQNKKAIGVEYSLGEGQPVQKALVKKEVILSGGSIHSPRILQLSGIGDKRLLNRLGIPVVLDLPGVGNNLQDHSALASAFNCKNDALSI